MFRRKTNIGVARQRVFQAETQPVLVAAGDQRCARGGADSRIRVSLQKTQSSVRDVVDIRRLDVRPSVAGDVGVAEIVCEKEDDVGNLCRLRTLQSAAYSESNNPSCRTTDQVAPRQRLFRRARHRTCFAQTFLRSGHSVLRVSQFSAVYCGRDASGGVSDSNLFWNRAPRSIAFCCTGHIGGRICKLRHLEEDFVGKLDGKVALITGGNSGIGLATAKRFVQEGAYVFITGRRQAELDEAVKQNGSNVTGIQGDVAKLGDLDRLFERIKKEKGKLDIVFANAGIAKYAPLGTIDEAHFDSIFGTNVKGLVFTVQNALPLLPDGASIILNASIVGSKGLPSNSIYAATKAAVRSFARTWTTDLKARRIRVNAISPGPIDTEGLRELIGSVEGGPDRLKGMASIIPLGRIGSSDEIAKAAVFLASDDSSFITGIELFVDGGFAQV